MIEHSAYVLFAASGEYRYAHLEELLGYKRTVLHKALELKRYVEFEIIFDGIGMSTAEQRRRQRLLSLVHAEQFQHVIFAGDVATPYVGAVRRAAYPHTPVHNASDSNSHLDFFLQMFEVDHKQSVRG